jgi:hypothetical protein
MTLGTEARVQDPTIGRDTRRARKSIAQNGAAGFSTSRASLDEYYHALQRTWDGMAWDADAKISERNVVGEKMDGAD